MDVVLQGFHLVVFLLSFRCLLDHQLVGFHPCLLRLPWPDHQVLQGVVCQCFVCFISGCPLFGQPFFSMTSNASLLASFLALAFPRTEVSLGFAVPNCKITQTYDVCPTAHSKSSKQHDCCATACRRILFRTSTTQMSCKHSTVNSISRVEKYSNSNSRRCVS